MVLSSFLTLCLPPAGTMCTAVLFDPSASGAPIGSGHVCVSHIMSLGGYLSLAVVCVICIILCKACGRPGYNADVEEGRKLGLANEPRLSDVFTV
uniref:FXYD domain-containing ion transport regulator n=1 Tax=Steinernema glaseri TaxID=37863 RepID=A0A1I8AB57_9BILA